MLCTKMRPRFKRLLKEFDNYAEQHIDIALRITLAIKQLLLSPAADMLIMVIPGDLDKAIRDQLVSALNKAIDVLTIADQCKTNPDLNEKIKCFTGHLKLAEPELQDAILQKLASLVAGHLDSNRLKQSSYDLFTQAKYTGAK